MRIFISYASERRRSAEPLAQTLRGRGHKVFFDKDDLPGGASYDERIESAIARSDLMIFLISPESVMPGRFTLTELLFAKRRWASAKGKVLPVLISETGVSDIPPYLSTVHIMKPEGNLSAEISAYVDSIKPRAKPQWVVLFAIIAGITSGTLSNLAFMNTSLLPTNTMIFWIKYFLSIILVSLPLAAAISYMFCKFEGGLTKKILYIIFFCAVAWGVAYRVAFELRNAVQPEVFGSITPEPKSDDIKQCASQILSSLLPVEGVCKYISEYRQEIAPRFYIFVMILDLANGAIAGFIGSSLIVIPLSFVCIRLRGIDSIGAILLSGSVFGTILFLSIKYQNFLGYEALFVVWQVSILSSIGWQFTKSEAAS